MAYTSQMILSGLSSLSLYMIISQTKGMYFLHTRYAQNAMTNQFLLCKVLVIQTNFI